MQLLWVELLDFRNHPKTRVDLTDGLTAIVGPNGEGKTNLLEAIAFLLTLASPRVSADGPLIRHGAEAAFIRGEAFTRDGRLLIEVEIRAAGANRVQVNRSPVRRKRDLRRKVRAVFFGPDDLAIVQADPGARRRFLDEAAIALWPQAETPIRAYEKTLRQRNRLLKDYQGVGTPADLGVWNEELISSGSQVTLARARAVAHLAPGADAGFRELAGYGMDVSYEPSVPVTAEDAEQIARDFHERLDARLSDELARRTTLVGPHRDDLSLVVRDLKARAFASHGEAWAAALSLRTGLAVALEGEAGEPPIRLYDDPFAALDPSRRAALGIALASPEGQTLIATPDARDVPASTSRVIEVAAGTVVTRSEPA